MSKDLDDFRADVARQLGPHTPEEWRALFPQQHLYARYGRYRSCAWCGKIEPRSVPPSPCRGVVKIGLRSQTKTT